MFCGRVSHGNKSLYATQGPQRRGFGRPLVFCMVTRPTDFGAYNKQQYVNLAGKAKQSMSYVAISAQPVLYALTKKNCTSIHPSTFITMYTWCTTMQCKDLHSQCHLAACCWPKSTPHQLHLKPALHMHIGSGVWEICSCGCECCLPPHMQRHCQCLAHAGATSSQRNHHRHTQLLLGGPHILHICVI